MHRWLLTLQNMACSTFRVGCSQNWIWVFFWQFKIFSMFLQVNEFFKSRKQEIKNQSWYVSLPPQCSQNCCSVTGEGRDQGPRVTTGCSMQKTLQNWTGACSKIILKVRTLQCCSDGLSQLGDLCFVPGDLYLDFEILHQKWNDWKGRGGSSVKSYPKWDEYIWVWYGFGVYICGRINTKTG